LKCAVIGDNPVVRIVTDAGLSGFGQAENSKPYLKPQVLFYKPYILGEDPTHVARVARPSWWYDIVDGLPNPIVEDGFIKVWDRPGLGVEFNIPKAQPYLSEADKDFFND
jgi:L-alanine-DL-glutamate epimerase-like enolase superfamily enzyme